MECQYRNCNNQLEDKRKGTKFCCRNCKQMERTYLKRKEKFIKDNLELQLDKIRFIKIIKNLQSNNE